MEIYSRKDSEHIVLGIYYAHVDYLVFKVLLLAENTTEYRETADLAVVAVRSRLFSGYIIPERQYASD